MENNKKTEVNLPKKSKNIYKLVIFIAILLIILGVTVYLFLKIDKNKTTVLIPCKDDDVATEFNAVGNFLNVESSKLNEIVTKIKAKPNYTNSASCMYILSLGSIRDGDIESARESYNVMIKLRANDKDNIHVFKNLIDTNTLDALITNMEKSVHESRDNMVLISAEEQTR